MKRESATAVSHGKSAQKAEEDAALLTRLLHEVPPLSAGVRAYYEKRQSEERAIALGTKTSADEYLRAAVKLYVQIAAGAEQFPDAFAGFTTALRRWCLEQLVALHAATEQKDSDHADDQKTANSVAAAMILARVARNALLSSLERAVFGDEQDEAALANARGTTHSAIKTLKSLNALVILSNDLLDATDDEHRIAVSEAALEPRLVTAVREASAQLQRALDAETGVGRKTRSHQDSPQMNILEGRATLSLRRMRGVYNAAREQHRALPALEIPEALAAVLRTSDSGEVVEEPVPEPVPEPVV